MIQAQEIRIGNFITHSNNQIEVLGITKHCEDYAIDNLDKWVYLKNCKSIPLTEDILLKCGFKNCFSGNILSRNNNCIFTPKKTLLEISFQDNIFELWTFFSHEEDNDHDVHVLELKHIKYLHQLQNLYFALTGNELEFNY